MPPCQHGPVQLQWDLWQDRTGWDGLAEAGAPPALTNASPTKDHPQMRPAGTVVMVGQGWRTGPSPVESRLPLGWRQRTAEQQVRSLLDRSRSQMQLRVPLEQGLANLLQRPHAMSTASPQPSPTSLGPGCHQC